MLFLPVVTANVFKRTLQMNDTQLSDTSLQVLNHLELISISQRYSTALLHILFEVTCEQGHSRK